MNLLEAIQNAGDNWFRPASWKGKTRLRFRVINGKIYGFGDDLPHLTAPVLQDLTGEWEIVTPEQVLSERKS